MDAKLQLVYEFQSFRLDPAARQLWNDRHLIPLSSKAFDTLLILLENRRCVVEKEKLLGTVWPDTIVEENNLNQCISALRKALGDTAKDHRFILTVPGRGYQFAASVVARENGALAAGPAQPMVVSTRQAIPRSWRLITTVVVSVLVLFVGLGIALDLGGRRSKLSGSVSGAGSISSLAVLPFETFSADQEMQYLGDGLTDDLTTDFAQLKPLRVVARTSTLRFRGRGADVREIGRQLGVVAVLEGSVRRSGNELRVTAQLINAANGYHMWANAYVGGPGDLRSFENDILRQTTRTIGLPMSRAQLDDLPRTEESNLEAHDLYLRARYLWNKRSGSGYELEKSIEIFEQAITKDPNYALAYAGLANAYAVYAVNYSTSDPLSPAKAAAAKAIELDPQLAEPHAALGLLKSQVEWDFAGAQEEFSRAMEVNTNYAPAHHWAGLNLTLLGQFDEARKELEKAQLLDPLSMMIAEGIAENYYYARRYDEAIEQCQKMLRSDPDAATARFMIAPAYILAGRYAEAENDLDQLRKMVGREDGTKAWLFGKAMIAARRGDKAEAARFANELELLYGEDSNVLMDLAWIYANLGQNDRAFTWLNRGLLKHDPSLAHLKVDPLVDPLRSDPRFAALLKKLGLSSAL